jgi:2-isopropylmalate synthase
VDISDIDNIRRTVEYCTGLPVHPRHPYAGDLVYTAFSGSHQDAIKKGLEDLDSQAQAQGATIHEVAWEAPYLPIDPFDVGRTYEAVIRVNSQSGKGGMAYLMKADHHYDLPRRLQLDFSRAVQRYSDATGKEVSSSEIMNLFTDEYLGASDPLALVSSSVTSTDNTYEITAKVTNHGKDLTIQGIGNGPVSAFVQALTSIGYEVKVLDYTEHALSAGGDAQAAAYVEAEIEGNLWWGVGVDPSIVTASLKAVCSAINRAGR